MKNFQIPNANDILNGLNNSIKSAPGIAVDPLIRAKAANMAKVMFWNAVRIVIALVFLVVFFGSLLAWGQGHKYWGVMAWMIISAVIIVRNIRKSIKETKRAARFPSFPDLPIHPGTGATPPWYNYKPDKSDPTSLIGRR